MANKQIMLKISLQVSNQLVSLFLMGPPQGDNSITLATVQKVFWCEYDDVLNICTVRFDLVLKLTLFAQCLMKTQALHPKNITVCVSCI